MTTEEGKGKGIHSQWILELEAVSSPGETNCPLFAAESRPESDQLMNCEC